MPGLARAAVAIALLVSGSASAATTFEVGPGHAYTAIGDVPWESLGPGDVVLIYWRATPYKEKWVIARQGLKPSRSWCGGSPVREASAP